MADIKISALPTATTPLTGAELVPIVQSGVTKQTTTSDVLAVPVTSLTASSAVATDASKKLVSVANTGTGNNVLATSPTLVTPALGTPSALVGTNITGTAAGLTAGNVTTNANLTGAVTSIGNATSLGSFTSANLASALTDETGTGSVVFATSPTLVTPILGTPQSVTLTNATGLPISSGVSGLGTDVATALAVNVGTAGSPVVNGGALGTPASGTLTNATGLPLTTGVTGLLPVANGGTGTATPSLVAGSNVTITGSWPNQTVTSTAAGGGGGTVTSVSVVSANGLAGTVANATTTPAITLSTSVTGVVKGNGTTLSAATAGTDYVAPGGALGTPSSGTVTNLTGTANITVTGGASGAIAATTLSASSTVSGTGFTTYLASPPAIGGTAAAAGAFTTLSASSTVSGTGFTTYLASPPAIGGTAAAAASFTSLNTGQLAGLRNRIINGGIQVLQRYAINTLAVTNVTGTPFYGPDRFYGAVTASGAAVNFGTSNDGSVSKSGLNHFYLQTGTTKASLSAGDYAFFGQKIEGTSVSDFKYGTANAKTSTLSFRAVLGNVGSAVMSVVFRNAASNRSYVTTVSLTSTVATYSVTVPGDTTGTWAADNTTGIEITFGFASGTTFQTSTLNAWQAGNFIAANTQTNLLATLNAAISISDIQLEIGSVATPFEQRPYGIELALCQRYLPVIQGNGSGVSYGYAGFSQSTGVSYFVFTPVVQPRIPPTGITTTAASGFSSSDGTTNTALTSISFQTANTTQILISGGASGLTAFRPCVLGVGSASQILFTGCEL